MLQSNAGVLGPTAILTMPPSVIAGIPPGNVPAPPPKFEPTIKPVQVPQRDEGAFDRMVAMVKLATQEVMPYVTPAGKAAKAYTATATATLGQDPSPNR